MAAHSADGRDFFAKIYFHAEANLFGSMTFSVGNHTLKPESIC